MLFGLFASLLGLGYAIHKDNQKFANMRADYTRQYGEVIVDNGASIYKENFYKVLNRFNERFDYYNNNWDLVADKQNFSQKTRELDGIEKEFILRSNAGFLAYADIISEFAPDWYQKYNGCFTSNYTYLRLNGSKPSFYSNYAPNIIGKIATGLTSTQLHSMGARTCYQLAMSSPFDCPAKYFDYMGYGRPWMSDIIGFGVNPDPKWNKPLVHENIYTHEKELYEPNIPFGEKTEPYMEIDEDVRECIEFYKKAKAEGKIK